MRVFVSPQARCTSVILNVLDGDAAVPLLAPDGQRVDQQHDELAVLHADGDHLPIGAVGGALGRMSQTYPVQQFLQQRKTMMHQVYATEKVLPRVWLPFLPYQPGPIFELSRHRWQR